MHNFFLSCDWGGSAFRLRLVDIRTRTILDEIISGEGMTSTFNRWKIRFEQGPISREDYGLMVLHNQVQALGKKTTTPLNSIPVLISGMASSSIGIRELPYAGLPFSLDGRDTRIEIIAPGAHFMHEVMLISGIRTKDDVIRGEETQMIGLAANAGTDFNGELVCLFPGTHSKHIRVKKAKLVDFKTYITGELFDLLTRNSILKESVSADVPPLDNAGRDAFKSGIIESGKSNLLNSLFSVRVSHLFKARTKEENYFFLSGLLIGTELKALRQHDPGHIQLCSGTNLFSLYKLALEHLDLSSKTSFVEPEIVDKSAVEGQLKIFHHHYD
jgi:2-dehydro-3-deoxygalactonokinase